MRPAAWRLAVLGLVVLLGHLLVLGLLPLGQTRSEPLPAQALRLVTRVVPAPAPPAPPRPRPAARVAPRVADGAALPAPATPDTTVPAGQAAWAEDAPVAYTAIETGAAGPSPPEAPDAAPEADPTGAASASPAPAPGPDPALAPAAPPPPVGLPAPVRLRYDMQGESKGLVYRAGAELLWQQDGARYSARMEVSAFLIGSRVQLSEGAVGAAGLEPERFTDKARKAELAAHFDRAAQRIVFSANTPEAPLPVGVQDRLSVFLQLGAQLAGDPGRYPVGTSMPVPTAGTRDLGDWVFVVGPQETLQLPIGTQVAVKLERAPRKPFDTRVEVWYAPALAYLPVRMRITQHNGDFIDQVLNSAERP